MGDALTIEIVLERGLGPFLNPAPTRQKAMKELPDLVATQLMGRVDEARRAEWAERFEAELWPALRAERGNRWDLGWAELTAGLALAIELLRGELPRAIQAELQGTPAEAAWRRARRPFQRFVLLVDSSVHVRRVFATARPRPPGVRVENSRAWAVDGPAFRDRSHTLMLALMADDALPEDAGPIAATGELLADGEGVAPVDALVEKATAWRQLHPDGLLISAPPGDVDAKSWTALASPPTPTTDRHGPNWVVGASLSEIEAKLKPAEVSVTGWDGTPLAEDALLEARLAPREPRLPEHPFREPLLGAAWSALQEARSGGQRRGVVIQGSPGSGKSILSLLLERRFARGALSAFGFGVRRNARQLAADIEGARARSWSAALALREPGRAALLDALETTHRLVPIVDGLDELQPNQLHVVAEWLRTGSGWWIATSRPLRGMGAELPSAWELHLEDLLGDGAHQLLVALKRTDLAEAIFPSAGLHGSSALLPETVQELTRTPLHTALLAKVVRPGEDLRALDPHVLYGRAFEALLDHACRSGRLSGTDARLVARLLSTVVGELAVAGLQSADGILDQGMIDAAFDGETMGAVEQVRALEALEFGHLLVPVGATWEFGHRTIAEWAAASALRRRVDEALREARAGPESRHRRAEIELAAIRPFLEDAILPGKGRWATLLRFYAPLAKEPMALLDRLLGPAQATAWRLPEPRRFQEGDPSDGRPVLRPASSTEILDSWSFAYEVLKSCKWTRPAEARAAWAIAVRRWLLPTFERPRYAGSEPLEALRAFSESVGAHLPEALDDLVELAAQTDAQRSRLLADPLVLLPAIPAMHVSSLAAVLERGSRRQQLAVIRWYSERGIEPPRSVLDRLANEVPDELVRAPKARAAEREQASGWSAAPPDVDDATVLSDLEAAVWDAYLAHGSEPAWTVVRRRFAAWPPQLDKHLEKWFGAVPLRDAWTTSGDDPHRQRRELLASLLEQAASVEREAAGTLAAIEDTSRRERVVDRVRYFFDDSDDSHLLLTLDGILSARGWIGDHRREFSPIDEEPAAEAVRQDLRRLDALRARATRLVGALDDTALESIVGGLWALLPPEHVERREILFALDRGTRVPRQIPAVEVIRHRGAATWRLEGLRWTPDHLEQLHGIARSGAGQLRYDCICILARTSGSDEVAELLRHLPSEDEIFTSLVYERLAHHGMPGDEAMALRVPDVSRLPLADRAARDVPGWRAELLAKLAGDGDEDVGTLIELAVRHEVREAMPLLARRLTDDWRASRPIEAIALLATDRDEEWARSALRCALRVGWPDGLTAWSSIRPEEKIDTHEAGAALGRFLRVDDLDVLAEGCVSALGHPSLAAAIRGLGPSATARLIALHEAAARRAAEIERASGKPARSEWYLPRPPSPELDGARSRRDSLAETLCAVLDPSAIAPAEMVDLLFRIAGEDVHEVSSIPGPLGSDFDEPEDMDWYSDQANKPLVEAAARALEKSLQSHPNDWAPLRRLFSHPSESLRKRAFELCADLAEPHEVAGLAIDALDGHVRNNRTRWTGQTTGLLLATLQRGGSGSVYVESPDTARSLVAAVRARLTPAHEDVIRKLAAHPLAPLRALAAQWAGELGDAGWIEIVGPMLEDEAVSVVGAALDASAALTPARLDALLADLRAERWTWEHDYALLQRLQPVRDLALFGRKRTNLASHLSEATLVRLLSRATNHAEAKPDPRGTGSDGCFHGFPSLVESVLSAWPRPLGPAMTGLFRAWMDHPAQSVREVGRRQLAVRGLIDGAVVGAWLAAPLPEDRLSGAECAVRMGLEPLRLEALRVIQGALVPYAWEPRRRVLWALQGATPAFAGALAFVANHFDWDDANGCLGPESEEIEREVEDLIRRWGEKGAVAVLELLDRGEVEDYGISYEVHKAAERHAAVFAAVRDGAARGGAASADLLQELSKGEFNRDVAGLAQRLTDEIFPPGWPEPSGWR